MSEEAIKQLEKINPYEEGDLGYANQDNEIPMPTDRCHEEFLEWCKTEDGQKILRDTKP